MLFRCESASSCCDFFFDFFLGGPVLLFVSIYVYEVDSMSNPEIEAAGGGCWECINKKVK